MSYYPPELVRDKVPEILIRQGMNPEIIFLSPKDHQRFEAIRNKLALVSGEALKAFKSGNPEEVLSALANLMELVGVAGKEYGISMQQIRQERDKKRAIKGGFDKFTILLHPNKPLR